jgi:hypothetical protein
MKTKNERRGRGEGTVRAYDSSQATWAWRQWLQALLTPARPPSIDVAVVVVDWLGLCCEDIAVNARRARPDGGRREHVGSDVIERGQRTSAVRLSEKRAEIRKMSAEPNDIEDEARSRTSSQVPPASLGK